MLSFDLNQTLLLNVGMDAFSVCIILIILISCRKYLAYTQDVRLLCHAQGFVIITLFADLYMWVSNGVPGAAAYLTSYLANMVYFIGQMLVAVEWLRYVYYRIYGKRIIGKAERLFIILPFIFTCVCVLTTPWTEFCFYLDEQNYYHRGVLAPVVSAIALSYILAAAIIALLHRKKEVLYDRRRELFILGVIAVPPFIGGVIQTLMFGVSLIWPCATFSVLLLYINIETQAISRDALTGLNNRGYLDRYLHTTVENIQDRSLTVFMLDVDHFKSINDRFGHEVGDEALIETANILKTTFKNSSAFLARYGGDEFVIVMYSEWNEYSAKKAISLIRENERAFNETGGKPYRLSLSIGYAICSAESPKTVEELMSEADEQMYAEKQKNRLSESV